jgi:hypothetical protein
MDGRLEIGTAFVGLRIGYVELAWNGVARYGFIGMIPRL